MKTEDWVKLGLTAAVLVALVGLAVLASYLPSINALYSQVGAWLMGVLGLHHGHDILSNKIDDGEDNDLKAPGANPTDDDQEIPAETPSVPVPAQSQSNSLSVTVAQLEAVMPQAGVARCQANVDAINATAVKWGINTPARLSMFLGNCALECDQLREMEEEWKPTPAQQDYEPPHHVARVLGNTQKGDGKRYKGRGVIQLTGRSNYRQAGHAIGVDLEATPELAAQEANAWQVAGWFWETHGLNAVADSGDFQKTVERINGGLTDLAQRQVFYDRAKKALA